MIRSANKELAYASSISAYSARALSRTMTAAALRAKFRSATVHRAYRWGVLARSFPRTRRRRRSAPIPTIVRLRHIVSCWPLGVTILAVVKTVLGTSWNAERRTKAIAPYIGATAKWARIKFHVTHVSKLRDVCGRSGHRKYRQSSPVGFAPICALLKFNARPFKTQTFCCAKLSAGGAKPSSERLPAFVIRHNSLSEIAAVQ